MFIESLLIKVWKSLCNSVWTCSTFYLCLYSLHRWMIAITEAGTSFRSCNLFKSDSADPEWPACCSLPSNKSTEAWGALPALSRADTRLRTRVEEMVESSEGRDTQRRCCWKCCMTARTPASLPLSLSISLLSDLSDSFWLDLAATWTIADCWGIRSDKKTTSRKRRERKQPQKWQPRSCSQLWFHKIQKIFLSVYK